MNPRNTVRTLSVGLLGLLVIGLAAPAWALDAYRDRRGILYGIHAGGGNVTSETDGSKGDGTLGFNIRGRLGGGVSQQLTLDGEIGVNFHSEDYAAGVEVSRQLYTMYVGANVFPIKDVGLYLRGMGGMVASVTVDTPLGNDSRSDTGLGVGAGAGYEFFVNADLAIGIGGDFQWIKIDDTELTMISFGINATWY